MCSKFASLDDSVKSYITLAFTDDIVVLMMDIVNGLDDHTVIDDELSALLTENNEDVDDLNFTIIAKIKNIINRELIEYSLLLDSEASLRTYKNALLMVHGISTMDKVTLEDIVSDDEYDAIDMATELYGTVTTEDKYIFHNAIRSINDDFIEVMKARLRSTEIVFDNSDYIELVRKIPALSDTVLYKYVTREGISDYEYHDMTEFIYTPYITGDLPHSDFIANVLFLLLTASDTKENYKHSLYEITIEDLKEYGVSAADIIDIEAVIVNQFMIYNGG